MIRRTLSKLVRVLGVLPLIMSAYWVSLKLASRYGVLSDIWYVFSGTFRREHRAILTGRLQHEQGLNQSRDNGAQYTLRRNTHRLEKGLIMRPRRSVFAVDYIEETVDLYRNLAAHQVQSCDVQTLAWARDVLENYFACADLSNPAIAKANSIFLDADKIEVPDAVQRRPYVRDLDQPLGFTVEDLHQLAYRRRSCRWFQQKPVPRELIDKAIEIGTLAPSACNRQPFEFRVFDNPELAQQVGSIPLGTTQFFHNFPCVVVIVGDMSAFVAERDRHVPYIDSGLAAMGFQFALELQDLSSCCINWPDLAGKEKAIAKALRLSPYQRVVMLLAVGYPDHSAMVPYSQKKTA